MLLDLIKNNDIQGLEAEIAKLKAQVDDFVRQAERELATLNGNIAALQSIVDEMKKETE